MVCFRHFTLAVDHVRISSLNNNCPFQASRRDLSVPGYEATIIRTFTKCIYRLEKYMVLRIPDVTGKLERRLQMPP